MIAMSLPTSTIGFLTWASGLVSGGVFSEFGALTC